MVKNLPAMRETWVWSLDWEDLLEEGMATHSSILAWRILTDRGDWQATVHGVAKTRTRQRLGTAQHTVATNYLLKKIILSPLNGILLENQLTIDVLVILGLSILFHWYVCLYLGQYHTVLITVTLSVEVSKFESFTFSLLFEIALPILGSSRFHKNLGISL